MFRHRCMALPGKPAHLVHRIHAQVEYLDAPKRRRRRFPGGTFPEKPPADGLSVTLPATALSPLLAVEGAIVVPGIRPPCLLAQSLPEAYRFLAPYQSMLLHSL